MKNKKKIISAVEKGLKIALENKMSTYNTSQKQVICHFMDAIVGRKIYGYFFFWNITLLSTAFGHESLGGYEQFA